MAPDVMDGDQGLTHSHCGSLGKVHTHQHRTNEAGSIGYSHSIDVIPAEPGFHQSLICKAIDGLNVLTAGNFRYNAAVFPMQRHLRGNAVAQNLSSILDDGYGSLVTTAFNCQNIHIHSSFLGTSMPSPGGKVARRSRDG